MSEEKENHLQNCLGKGYVSSREGNLMTPVFKRERNWLTLFFVGGFWDFDVQTATSDGWISVDSYVWFFLRIAHEHTHGSCKKGVNWKVCNKSHFEPSWHSNNIQFRFMSTLDILINPNSDSCLPFHYIHTQKKTSLSHHEKLEIHPLHPTHTTLVKPYLGHTSDWQHKPLQR